MTEKMTFEDLLNAEYSKEAASNIRKALGEAFEPKRVFTNPRAMHNAIARVIAPMFNQFVNDNKLDKNHPDIKACKNVLSPRYHNESRKDVIPFVLQLMMGQRDIKVYQKMEDEKELNPKSPDFEAKMAYLLRLKEEGRRVEKTYEDM